VTDICAPGFICLTGQAYPGPYVITADSTGAVTSGKCPIGYMCTGGAISTDATTFVNCPATTYQPTTQVAKCEYCPPGKFCVGGSAIVDCSEGYYCSRRSSATAPTTVQSAMGGICPMQHYCGIGTSQPLICPDGYIQRKVGRSYCDKCPSGYTCKAGIQTKCDQYKVCLQSEAFDYSYGK